MPGLDTRRVGDGPKRSSMWLDGVPCMVTGLNAWPKVGDRLVIDGELWRVVDARRSYICERSLGLTVTQRRHWRLSRW
jgi:hypothetical protein